MLQSCAYQFGINLKEKKYELTKKSDKIFCKEDVIGFWVREKSFGLKNHKLMLMTEYYEHHRNEKNWEICLKLLNIRLNLEDKLLDLQSYLNTQGEIADIHLLKGNPQESILTCKQAMEKTNAYDSM